MQNVPAIRELIKLGEIDVSHFRFIDEFEMIPIRYDCFFFLVQVVVLDLFGAGGGGKIAPVAHS